MPVLDAKALETDPEGLAFLRAVLKGGAGEPAPADTAPLPRRSLEALPPCAARSTRVARPAPPRRLSRNAPAS